MSWIERHEQMNLVQMRSGNSHLIYNSRNVLFPPSTRTTTTNQDAASGMVKDNVGNGNQQQYPSVNSNSTELVNISNEIRRPERRRLVLF